MNIDNEIESAAVSDRGLSDSRPENEDSYLDLSDCGIFAVADGVGGAEAGEVASQMAIEILSEAFTNLPENADPEEVMRAALAKANESIFQMSSEIPQLSSMATTIAALHLRGDVATIGHVGDSRLYRMDRAHKLVQETDDHSVVADEVRAGRLSPEQAATHPSRNIISRALGAEPTVDVDLKTLMIEPGTSFLLCTDGVTRHVADNEIRELLASDDEPGGICGRLKDLCYERGAEDNLTAVVVRLGTANGLGDTVDESYYPLEEEEITVATARLDEEAVLGPDEIVEPPEAPHTATVETLNEPADDHPGVAVSDTSNTFQISDDEAEFAVVEQGEQETAVVASADPPADRDFINERHREIFGASLGYDPEQRSSTASILMMAGILVIGVLAGGIGVYFWVNQTPPVQPAEVPTINEMKSTNIPLTSFEESRRAVDRDPARYIALNPNPQEAEDFFLLGRAYLLTGEYFLARNALTTAKSRLSEIDPRDARTISNEIELALAVIGSGAATESFSKAISPGTATPAGSATNAAAPASTP